MIRELYADIYNLKYIVLNMIVYAFLDYINIMDY